MFEEQIILYIFVNNLEKVKKITQKAFTRFKITKTFIVDVLIKNLKKVAEKNKSVAVKK